MTFIEITSYIGIMFIGYVIGKGVEYLIKSGKKDKK